MKLLRDYLFLWCFISLTSLSHPLAQPSRPPSFLLSFFFPPIPPFSSCHPWAGGLSLWEVKGHCGWEGSWQVVWALCTHFPIAHVKCLWTLTLVGPHSQNPFGAQFRQPDPIQHRTFLCRRKESRLSQLWSVALPLFSVKQGRTTGRHKPGQDFQKAYSVCDLTPKFPCWLTWIKRWESRGVPFHWVFHPLKCTLFHKFSKSLMGIALFHKCGAPGRFISRLHRSLFLTS